MFRQKLSKCYLQISLQEEITFDTLKQALQHRQQMALATNNSSKERLLSHESYEDSVARTAEKMSHISALKQQIFSSFRLVLMFIAICNELSLICALSYQYWNYMYVKTNSAYFVTNKNFCCTLQTVPWLIAAQITVWMASFAIPNLFELKMCSYDGFLVPNNRAV